MSIQREGPSRHRQVQYMSVYSGYTLERRTRRTRQWRRSTDLQEGDEGLGELELLGRGRSRALLLVVLEDGRLTPVVDVRGVVSRAVVHTGVAKPSVTSHHRRR